MISDQQTYMNSCEFDIMHNIVFAGVGQLLNLGEGPRSNLSYHVSNFKATTLPYFFRIPHLKGILGLIQWLEPYPHHIQIHCQHHYHHHPYPLQLCVSCPLVSRRKCTSIYVSRGLSRLGILTLIINMMKITMVGIRWWQILNCYRYCQTHGGILTGGNMLVSHHNHHGDCHHRSHFQYLGTIRI